ncbi:hypothetical protein ACJMK2_010705 [Sinanodonta woodiana]|uniref:Nuclear GTPase SLIP-GC n=1 Tax=Sinanodonta woodiana TaxID=1069815 RepID=A0ABD3VGC1_SINWO
MRMNSETKSKEFAPYVEGHGEDMNPCSSPELGSDDCNADSDVAMDMTENDTDSTLSDSTMRCLPFISAPVNNENVISVDQVKETFSQQHAMSHVIPQQARIFPKASTADHDELLFSDQSDDDDNGISSLKISALVDEIQTTPVVDEAESIGETPSNGSSQHHQFPPEGDHAKVTTLVTRCKSILAKFRKILNHQMDVLQTNRMQALNDELGKIEKWSEMPRVVIAVVGNTGDGKSSLMNAILGHSSILPTSGIRACTAVVVEVVQNSGSLYEGCIEFLTKEEWYSELERLIKDLTSSDGKLRRNPPEPDTDQYVSYCKVKAVYGKIATFEALAGINKVTSHLGKLETVKCKQAQKFRKEVERYIETQEPQSGGQFWPIVKRVQLRLPNCDVCRTGAVLVDLPGVRDSNAARDKIARDYLKTCSAIWVVSAIHRAIDDKTAQDLLTENFRRQLLMDGQYGSVAFICTKSDQFEKSEIIRTLKLQDRCKDHEHKISIMEKKRQRLLEEIKICRKKTQKLNKEIMSSLKECEDLQSLVQQIDTKQNQIQELETQIRQRRRILSHICASARNDYCREKIKQKFQLGFKEIKRQANRLPDADEDDDDDNDDDEVNKMVNSLKVFCCSSTEYQKLKEFTPADGEPTVFSSPEETEIPSLQAYVHEITRIRHEQYLERLIRGLGRCTFNFQSYLLDGGTECVETRTGVKLVIEKCLQDLNSWIEPVIDKMAEDLESTFNDVIQAKFNEGVGLAAQEVTGICQKWGSKQSTDQANRRAGGLHLATYKATIHRLGVYSSPTFGNIDMNEELSEPFYRTIAVVWSKVFSLDLWKILKRVKTDIRESIQQFNQKVGSELQKMEFLTNRIGQMKEQVESSVKYELTEMVLHLKPLVTAKQRDISRIMSLHVQFSLVETYKKAASHTGKGCFQQMKQEMEIGIDSKKMYIFDGGSKKMMQELQNLKTELVNTVTAVCDMLLGEIQLSFEPLWKDPSQSVLLKDTLQQHMEEVCKEMKTIYRDASLQNTEEHAQSRKKPATTHHPPTPKRPQKRKNVIDIVNMFINPVPKELTKMTKLEVVKVEKGSRMYPVQDVKHKPGSDSDSGSHNPSDVASSSGIHLTRNKEVLSELSAFLQPDNVEPPSHPAMLSSENSVNPSSMAGPSNVYDFGEASVTKNNQHDQAHKKRKVGTNQRHIRIAPKNIPPEVQLALENHMVRRSKQQTENSSITVAAQEEAGNSTKGSSRAMVSTLKPKSGTSTAAKEKQLAEISSSDSRQLILGKRKTSSTSTMEPSSSGQAGTSLPFRRSKQQTENSSIAVATQEESGNSTRGSSRAMVSTLKPKPGTSTAAKEKQLAEISSSDSRQLIPGKRKTSSTSTMEPSSSGQAGTSLPFRRSKQQTENSSIAVATQEESGNSTRGSSRAMVSTLKPKPGTSTAAKEKQLAEISSSDSRQLIPGKRKTSSTSTMEPSSSGQAGTSLPFRRSKQQTENSSIAVATQEESGNSTRGSSRAMVSTLKPKPGTSTAAKEKQLAEISSSDSMQLIPGKRKTSSTSTMKTSSSGQAGTSLFQSKETTSKGRERNSCNIKGNPSSDLKRTAPSISTGTNVSGIKTPLSDKMETPLPIVEDDDSLPEISVAKRRKKTYREQNNPHHENVQENPTCTSATSKISQKISTDTSLSTSSVSSRPRLLSNSKTKGTSISKTQSSKETGSSKTPQRNKLRIEHSDDSSSSSEMLQVIKQEPQEGDHIPHKQQSRHKQSKSALVVCYYTTAAQEKTKNSLIAATAQEEPKKSARRSSRAIVRLLKPKPGTSTAAKEKQLAEISDSRQLIPVKRKTSSTSTMETSSSGKAGTSLIRPKETTSKGRERNSCNIKGNPSSDLKRTAPSVDTVE